MSETPSNQLKLDPWAASSLLQKAIRRGEVELAQHAAHAFYRYRGALIFRRLTTIAVEDIGIADVGLVQEVARFAADKVLRSILGSDAELIDELCLKMSAAPKDRSADYLWSAATLLETARGERAQLQLLPTDQLIEIAVNEGPLIRRASAALLACTIEGKADPILLTNKVDMLLDALPTKSSALADAVQQLAGIRAHPFCLLLPLIWSRFQRGGGEVEVVGDELPETESVGGVPLYTYDKHTALGKNAIATFARANRQVAAALQAWVPDASHRASVAEMAAFYCDAAPVKDRLDWASGRVLQFIGLRADILSVGCEFDGISPVLDAVGANLPHLNKLRRARRLVSESISRIP